MVTVELLQLKNPYRIVWLRYVSGLDLSHHCMKSLLGYNDRRFRGFMRGIANAALDQSKYYYLCGVDADWVWSKNMHIAFVEKQGSVIEEENMLYKVRIRNAAKMEISTAYIDWDLPQARNRLFNTCRNWQFACMLHKIDPDLGRNQRAAFSVQAV